MEINKQLFKKMIDIIMWVSIIVVPLLCQRRRRRQIECYSFGRRYYIHIIIIIRIFIFLWMEIGQNEFNYTSMIYIIIFYNLIVMIFIMRFYIFHQVNIIIIYYLLHVL